MALLEARPYRPFKSSEEYLYAMKEDLAEWLNALYPALDLGVDNFLDRLETGVLLCKVSLSLRAGQRAASRVSARERCARCELAGGCRAAAARGQGPRGVFRNTARIKSLVSYRLCRLPPSSPGAARNALHCTPLCVCVCACVCVVLVHTVRPQRPTWIHAPLPHFRWPLRGASRARCPAAGEAAGPCGCMVVLLPPPRSCASGASCPRCPMPDRRPERGGTGGHRRPTSIAVIVCVCV
ncbi:hypothetical protein ONE63_010975 [Megalurothrips usitatus]|uniref:Uncharacterized protein n=1 Tax=Megalurothrips usitatus TaxID=439358 RepID=A0AAV7XI66_9NEOP|nr:hypothetical protein ONE63_010975 [Megalurothrips usitatus]